MQIAPEMQYPIGKFQRPETREQEVVTGAIQAIELLPTLLEAAIENMDAEHLNTPYREGGWTPAQIAHHIADSHMNAYVRFKLALTEDNPTIKPYKQDLWAELSDNTVPVNVSVTLVHALHRRLTTVLKSMQEGEWMRTYFHPEQQRNVPLWEVVSLYAWHGRHHVEQILRFKERIASV
jgi:DinB superfamily